MPDLKRVCVVVGLCLLMAGGLFAQTSTEVQKAEVEIIYVHGNTVVFQMGDQVLERTVAADFRVMVDGKPTPVSELVPGQKVMLEKTTTTTVVPASRVVKVREAEVIQVVGRTVLLRENGETKKVVAPPDFKFMREGKLVYVTDLRPGDKVTKTVVTETAESSSTVAQVGASATAPKPAPAAEPAPAPAAPAPAPAPAPKLPKTGSQLPLIGLTGGLLLALGVGLLLTRRLF
jgi:LPXTG-motif cell wall-anchored protein